MRILPITVNIYNSSITEVKRQKTYTSVSAASDFNSSALQDMIMFKSVLQRTGGSKAKLIKQIDAILKENKPVLSDNEWIASIVDSVTRFFNQKKAKLKKLGAAIEAAKNAKYRNIQEKANFVNPLVKEYNRINKSMPPTEYQREDIDKPDKYDYALIHRFRNAILDGNYNLMKVFQDYYSGLNEIETIEELKEKYPLIKIPKRPIDVIAKKIVDRLDRAFYRKFAEYLEAEDADGLKKITDEAAAKIILSSLKDNSNQTFNANNAEPFGDAIVNAIINRFSDLHRRNSIGSVPSIINLDKNLLTQNDLNLLKVDYDDFVLSIIKLQYLNFYKPSEILYRVDGDFDLDIRVSDLKDSEYKFEKISEKIKKLISDADKIRFAEREYNKYTPEDFKQRIEFYTERFGDDEDILEKMVEFDSSRFTHEDNTQLTKILSELDKIWDGEKSLAEVKESVNLHEIKPHGTYRLNNIERAEMFAKAKAEQRIVSKLRQKQEQFDNIVEILYKNNLNYLAEIISKYRPVSLEASDENALFVTNLVKKYCIDDKITNPKGLQSKIMSWNKYIEYKTSGTNPNLLRKAEEYAASPKGNTDVFRAGNYIMNTEIIAVYPENKQYLSNADIVEKILATSANQNEAVVCLCKYNDYSMLEQKEKSRISNLINIFDVKVFSEKAVLRKIIEDEYITTDTYSEAVLNKTKRVPTAILANAKQQLYDYYRFPSCIEYFEAFENALSFFAPIKGSAGIKKIGNDVFELKIKGSDDRLVAEDGTCYFYKFDNTGLH